MCQSRSGNVRGVMSTTDDYLDPQAPRDLVRATALRWRAVGCIGRDREDLLRAADVLERQAVAAMDARQDAHTVRTADGAAEVAGHREAPRW